MTAGSIQLSQLAELERLTAFVEARAHDAGADDDTRFALRLAVEEAFTNIMQHGYGGAGGPVAVSLQASDEDIAVVLRDRAPEFDPGQAPAADLDSPWSERDPGGLGWHLLRQVTDQVTYQRNADGENVLTLVKRIAAGSE